MNEIRQLYRNLAPFLCQASDISKAKDITLNNGTIPDEDEVFGDWSYIDDRFAAGGGYNLRRSYVKLDEETPYEINYFDEYDKPHKMKVYGLVELIQFKSSVYPSNCTIVGDLSFAKYVECT